MGVSEEKFWDSAPVELKPYKIAYQKKKESLDEDMWTMGLYVLHAVNVAVDKALHGRKSQAEYMSAPFLQQDHDFSEDDVEKLTDEELANVRRKKLEKLDEIARRSFGIKEKKDLDQGE